MNSIRKIIFSLTYILLALAAKAQIVHPFYNEIMAFKREDSINFPLKGGILFVGSSSIRKWSDLKERFADYPVIQRGFGGSEMSDVLYYADKIVLPYRPSKIFLYEGDNDIAAGKSVETVYKQFKEFYDLIADMLPETKIYFISVKPSPSRVKFMPKFEQLNKKIKKFISKHSCKAAYIDVYHPMLKADGQPMQDIFLPDNLHMLPKGYDIWEKQIRPYL